MAPVSGPKLREPTEDEDSLTAPCGRGKGGQWGAEGVPHPSCLTPRSSPHTHTAPAAAAGGDSAFLAKQLDLLCSRNYEKNVCHELSRGRLSEERGLRGPRRAARRPAATTEGGKKARRRESFWGVRAVAAGQGWTSQSRPPGIFQERRNDFCPSICLAPCHGR